MTPLVPTIKNGYTISERPTFLVYVPETNTEEAFFSIQDEDRNQVYETIVALPETPGVVSVTMPENAPALEMGRRYDWFVVAMCDGAIEPDSPLAAGSVQRREGGSLPAGETYEEIEVLAENGVWYDAVASLAELRRSQPDDSAMAAAWEELLNSVELDEIASAPLSR